MILRWSKIAITVIILASVIFGGYLIFAQTDQFSYDGEDHLIGITFYDNSSMQYSYDVNGNLVTKTYQQ